jgi:hypothetical protein
MIVAGNRVLGLIALFLPLYCFCGFDIGELIKKNKLHEDFLN